MPSKSKKQQRFFGLVHAYQQGKVKNPSEDVKRVAASISESDAEHFAKTKHEGLPEKAAETQEELATRWEAQRAAGLHDPVTQAALVARANSTQGGVPQTSVLDRVLGWFKKEPTQEELRARFHEQNPDTKPDAPVGSVAGTQQLQQKASEWIKMFKQAGGAGHEAFLAAEQAQKTVEKCSLFKEVDPYRRYNVDARAQKVLSKLLEPEDSEKEFDKKKKEVDKKVDEDKETLRAGAGALAKALNMISDWKRDTCW